MSSFVVLSHAPFPANISIFLTTTDSGARRGMVFSSPVHTTLRFFISAINSPHTDHCVACQRSAEAVPTRPDSSSTAQQQTAKSSFPYADNPFTADIFTKHTVTIIWTHSFVVEMPCLSYLPCFVILGLRSHTKHVSMPHVDGYSNYLQGHRQIRRQVQPQNQALFAAAL
jgi:hypothetical protein